MHRLNINAPYELLDKAFGLSLSDQYWLKQLDTNLTYADVNTLNWLDVAPIFDNGGSLNIEYYDSSELHISGEGRLFYEVKPFDEIIKVVKDIKRIDISLIEDLPEWYDELLHHYQYLTKYSDTRINHLCVLFNRQINKLKNLIENSN